MTDYTTPAEMNGVVEQGDEADEYLAAQMHGEIPGKLQGAA
jgi:hypothetical protein